MPSVYSLLTLLAVAVTTFAISVKSPSTADYWVQDQSNTIRWSSSSDDPNPVGIAISNNNPSTLNGFFAIAELVDISKGSFTVTNVTLRVASGYVVNFVNASNTTQVYASSQQFDVKNAGTTPATVSEASVAATATNASASGTATGNTASATPGSAKKSGASRAFDGSSTITTFVCIAMALAGGFLAL